MKKILLITLVAAFALSSCQKDSLGVSKVTTYATLTLNGAEELFWPLNTAFVDPSCVAMEGTTNITSKLEVTSNVNATKGGKYLITYKVKNSDGFYAEASRIVYVYDATSPLNGIYSSSISRTNTTSGAVGARGPFNILVFGVGGSNFWVEDLMGGWYYYGSGYGIGYAGTAVLTLNADNTLSIVKSNPTSFGAASACVFFATSTYDPATKTLVIHSNMGDTSYLQFTVTMKTPTPFN
jgi:hypothetical protein